MGETHDLSYWSHALHCSGYSGKVRFNLVCSLINRFTQLWETTGKVLYRPVVKLPTIFFPQIVLARKRGAIQTIQKFQKFRGVVCHPNVGNAYI